MPKIVSEKERKLTLDAIYEKTVALIKENGIRTITVDDITTAVGMGKGSFYSYYPSKEACLFEVIKRCEREFFSRIEGFMRTNHPHRERIVYLLKEVYTAKDSLVTSITQTDVEVLLRKLPPEYTKMEKEKSEHNFQRALAFMNLTPPQMEVVALLSDCLAYAASNHTYSPAGTDTVLDILIHSIADYIVQEGDKHESEYEKQ